ncbi:MAG: helix-turn-helix domain-containing protein [Gammaproteobacteria bacterium]
MSARDLRAARLAKSWTQTEAARRLGVSQPYLAMLERGQRRLAPNLALRAAKLYGLSPTVVPRSPQRLSTRLDAATLARDLAGLGYPGLAYLRLRSWTPKNPGDVLLTALAQDDLEPRLVEALPWVALRYCTTLDWSSVLPAAKIHDLQNRLGFVVDLARRLAERAGDERKAGALANLESQLERSRLAREDTLCRASLPEAERRWLAQHRPDAAKHWNLLTDWTADALRYVA